MLKPIESPADFLDELPDLDPDESFNFCCGPSVACFNACCRDLDLVLGPYDVLRLRQALELSSRQFLEKFTAPVALPPGGFPALQLLMGEEPEKRCPFVTAKGCSVYEHRPSPCRAYPVGRGAELNPAGQIEQRFVLLREAHCLGFASEHSWTVRQWLDDQGLGPYNSSNDRYL